MRFVFLIIASTWLTFGQANITSTAKDTAEFAAVQYTKAAEKALKEMVEFKTVARDDLPYKQNPEFNQFRKWLVKKADELGLEVTDHGYVVTISTGQGEKKVLGLITHGDVQPANPAKWSNDPFSLDTTSEPGKLIGRGTEDDKGPIAAALYSMKAIKDKKIALRGQIELIVYMAEESDWAPLQEFLTTFQPAPVNIALDSEYPVVTAEKGWSHIKVAFNQANDSEIIKNQTGPTIVSFKGGTFHSQIPEEAVAELQGITAKQLAEIRYQLRQYPVEFETTPLDNSVIVSVKGKSAHSSKPEHGINAINTLAEALKSIGWQNTNAAFAVRYLNDLVGTGIHGKKFGNLAYTHNFMGPMTLSPTLINTNQKGELEVFINIRRPLGKSQTVVTQEIKKALSDWKNTIDAPMKTLEIYVGEPLMVENAPHVDELLRVFGHFTKTSDPKPVAIGGSTNAKLFPNAVSFGPSMPDTEYTGHSEHEFITREQFILTIKMYTAMMIEIAQ